MDQDNLSKKINRIDYDIVKLLSERLELAIRTKKMTGQITDENREKEIFNNILRFSHGLIKDKFARQLFADIIGESKRLQKKELKLIGFQGEHGANSELAAKSYNEDLVAIPCLKFSDVYDGVVEGKFDLGILPVENTIEGAVNEVNDLLIDNNKGIYIVGEVRQPINHCLLALPETDYREIKVVYSHPQALAQCRGFISRNDLEIRPFYDTAGAARMISNTQPRASAAIASQLCAELYNLVIIKENIEDEATNFTRFLIVSQEKPKQEGNKCSIAFSTQHKAGELFGILKIFSDNGINLSRIESRPIKNDPGNYAFIMDFNGSDREEKIKKILKLVEEKAVMYKFLGCYREMV